MRDYSCRAGIARHRRPYTEWWPRPVKTLCGPRRGSVAASACLLLANRRLRRSLNTVPVSETGLPVCEVLPGFHRVSPEFGRTPVLQ